MDFNLSHYNFISFNLLSRYYVIGAKNQLWGIPPEVVI